MRATSIRDHLLRRRHAILARYHGVRELADEELAGLDPEEIERSTEQWDAQVLSKLGDTDARTLAEIVAALRRIDNGDYGMCTECGEWIGMARLEAMPAAMTCIDCASSAERVTAAPPPFKRVGGSVS
jgi:RNA polymerase-binding protein DksA